MIQILQQNAEVVAHTDGPSAAVQITRAATTCYNKCKDDSYAIEFCEKLKGMGHTSPFEFYTLVFSITTSRAVSHELVRHRMASYMQESQRYCGYADSLPVIKPVGLPESALPTWVAQLESAHAAYNALLSQGVRKEDARTVLPTATATRLRMAINLRSFQNFLTLRTAPQAWSSMRDLATRMAVAAVQADATLGRILILPPQEG